MTGLSPMITVVISLSEYGVILEGFSLILLIYAAFATDLL